MTTFSLIRHGETEWNRTGKVQGISDIPLNQTGVSQAQDAVSRLLDLNTGINWAAVVTSTLSRAHETGRIIANGLGIPLLDPIAELVERNYGLAEGREIDWVSERFPTWEIPDSESNETMIERASRALDQLRNQDPNRPLIVVAHGGLIRNFMTWISGTELDSIANTSVNMIEHADGAWKVRMVNGRPFDGIASSEVYF